MTAKTYDLSVIKAPWSIDYGTISPTFLSKDDRVRFICIFILAALSSSAIAAGPGLSLPSCNLEEQRALVGETGGQITDIRQAHISMRANVLSADLSSSRKARRLTERQADRMIKRIEEIRSEADRFVKQQVFLSATEKASMDRKFDAIAKRLCK